MVSEMVIGILNISVPGLRYYHHWFFVSGNIITNWSGWFFKFIITEMTGSQPNIVYRRIAETRWTVTGFPGNILGNDFSTKQITEPAFPIHVHPFVGAPGRNRTRSFLITGQLLCLLSYQGMLVGVEGVEPPTPWSQAMYDSASLHSEK